MDRDQELAYWAAICQGERCCICEAPFPPPYNRSFAFCLDCVPEGAPLPHTVSVHVDHHVEGFSVHVVCEEPPRWVLWMVALSQEEVAKLMELGRTSPFIRNSARRALQQWGRTSMTTHIDEGDFNRLYAAYRRDPRTGYEKTQALERRGK